MTGLSVWRVDLLPNLAVAFGPRFDAAPCVRSAASSIALIPDDFRDVVDIGLVGGE